MFINTLFLYIMKLSLFISRLWWKNKWETHYCSPTRNASSLCYKSSFSNSIQWMRAPTRLTLSSASEICYFLKVCQRLGLHLSVASLSSVTFVLVEDVSLRCVKFFKLYGFIELEFSSVCVCLHPLWVCAFHFQPSSWDPTVTISNTWSSSIMTSALISG